MSDIIILDTEIAEMNMGMDVLHDLIEMCSYDKGIQQMLKIVASYLASPTHKLNALHYEQKSPEQKELYNSFYIHGACGRNLNDCDCDKDQEPTPV